MIYALLEDRPARRFGLWFPALLAAGGVVVSLLTALSRGRVEFWVFQVSFTSAEFYGLYRVWRIHRRSRDPRVHRLFRAGMAFYAVAVVSWVVDMRLCSFVSRTLPAVGLFNPQLHAVWHVFVAFGFYTLVVLIALDRCDVLGREVRLERWLGIAPRLASSGSDAGPHSAVTARAPTR
jgi:dihydroceramidase